MDVLLAPWRILTDPTERMWWPALLLALLAAGLWEVARGRNIADVLRSASRGVGHPSSIVDVQLVFVRAAVRLGLAGFVSAAAMGLAVWLVVNLHAVVGAPPAWARTGGLPWLVAAYSATLLVVSDASRYGVHRAMHGVPWLWRFHQVHHSAEVLTPVTLYRIHPVEQSLQAVRRVMVLGMVGGGFAWVSGGLATPWEVYGVPALMLGFNLFFANLRHSHVRIPYPQSVERWLISPWQHQIHHRATARGGRSNYGSFLAIWDRALGTLRYSREEGAEPAAVGVEARHLNHDPRRLASALIGPLRP